MANNSITINKTEVSIKEYKSSRVVTFKDIDTVHGRPEGTARKRFNDNKEHFIEGVDFYVIDQPSEIRTLGITRPQGGTPQSVTLLTESGYLMLVKSFTDDLAWDVQRQLVNTYFRVATQNSADTIALSIKQKRADAMYINAQARLINAETRRLLILQKEKGLSQVAVDTLAVKAVDCNPQAGAWIRFNPLDGKGVKNDNVTEYRYALIESDCMPLEQQNALIRELELPVAVLVYSGGKSVHAIVRVDAANYDEYRRRVDYLYNVCRKNGLEIDRQNRNPSRLSRMPGVTRGGKKQYIIDTNIGKRDWTEWRDWIESMNDDLPDFENLADYFDNPPPLAPPLIDGVLRQGHKMLIAGPPKAGKSFALIELAIAIAEGVPWLGFNCAQGKVMYVNLELDKASCYRRFIDVYKAMGVSPENVRSIDIWNLRGLSVPMDKLAPMLIRRAAKKGFIAVIIDPIYKVLTGDENSAEQMARFCNQFDKVCTELGCSVIYCHHHSKGSQGGKRSMDRASGSGVFSRDPDALLDLTELEITESLFIQQENAEICEAAKGWISRFHKLDEVCSQDDMLSAKAMVEIARKTLTDRSFMLMMQEVDKAKKAVRARRAWRVEGTLREFKALDPVDLWFSYPVHILDESGVLGDCEFDGDRNSKNSPYGKNFSKKKSKEEKKEERLEALETAFSGVEENGRAEIKDIADYLGVTEKTVRNHLKEHGGFWINDNQVIYREKENIE